jgi:uncharacterized protein YhfF
MLVDGNGHPLSVVRTTQVSVAAFGQVDAEFAWDEGEGDRSLAWWRAVHLRYFRRQAETENFLFDEDLKVVLERFEIVWPRLGSAAE